MTPRSTELYFRKMLPLGLIVLAVVMVLGWVSKQPQTRREPAPDTQTAKAPAAVPATPKPSFEALMAKLGDPVSVETQAGKPIFFWRSSRFEVQLDSQRRIVSISTPAYDAAPAAAVELSEITALKIRQWQDENKDLWITLE